MAKKEKKFYVVWEGLERGVFETWDSCKKAVSGIVGSKYMSFPDRAKAEKAFAEGPDKYWGKPKIKVLPDHGILRKAGNPIMNSICVDAACNGATGQMEYKGVYTDGGQLLFKQGPYQGGSNNIGEFLAIIHALAWCKKHQTALPVYTDSNTAIAWVKKKKANTKVLQSHKNVILFNLIQRAETWLQQNTWKNPVLKWNTRAWGEIPADFGRK